MSVLGVVGFRVDATGSASNPSFRCSWGRTPTNKEGVLFDSKGLYLQRSTTVNNWPDLANAGTTPSYIVGTIGARTTPLAQTGWTTIKSWNAADTAAMTANESFTDSLTAGTGLTAGQAMYAYRLIYFATLTAGLNPTYEVDYPPVRITNTPLGFVRSFGGAGSGNDLGYAVAVDSSGNIIVAGSFQGSSDFGGGMLTSSGGSYDMVLSKYTPAGVCLWSRRYGTSGAETPTCIALDNSGNILVGGNFTGTANFGGSNITSNGAQDAFIAKYNSSGDHQWSVGFGALKSDSVTSVAADSTGNVIITGWYENTSSSTQVANLQLRQSYGLADTFLIKFSPAGTGLWAKNFYNGSADYGRGVAVDGSENIILGGYFNGNINLGGGDFDSNHLTDPGGYLAKFDNNGNHIWSKRYGDTSNQTRFWTMAIDSNGDIVVAGDFLFNTDLGGGNVVATSYGVDGFTAKFSGVNGAYIWAAYAHGDQVSLIQPAGIVADADGNVIVTGNLEGKYNFGNKSLGITNTYDTDGFVAKYSSAGALVWLMGFGGTYAFGMAVDVDSSGYSVVTGFFLGAANVFGQSMTSSGYDEILIKIAP